LLKAKESTKKPVDHDDERKSLVDKKDEEKGEKKASTEEEGKEPEEKEKSLVETATDFNFMKSGIKRFLITIALFIVTDLTDRSFKTIWQLRSNNSLANVLLSALIVLKRKNLIF
jgi:hypothetical protein